MSFPLSVKDILLFASIILGILLVFSFAKKEKSEGLKEVLFWGMTVVITFTTFYLALDTVVKNQQSVTRGPVHWHADYEIYVCGQSENKKPNHNSFRLIPRVSAQEKAVKVDLKDPRGISNRIGPSDFHEHGDDRIHVEGVVENLADVSLGNFFRAIGGELTSSSLALPTNDGSLHVDNSDLCPDGQPGTLQTFVYKTQGKIVIQKKLTNFTDYVISPESQIPPGDCIIVEFGPVKERTDKLCNFYKIAIDKGELTLQK